MTRTAVAAAEPTAKPSFIALLIAASAVSPLGINMYLPSMPGMARTFGVEFATIQLTLLLYLAAMACGQLIIGSLSDRFRRRPMLLIGLLVFVLGSLVCLIAQNVGTLIFGRVMQAVGGCAGITIYKLEERGAYTALSDPRRSSHECSSCGQCDAESRKSQAVFGCVACSCEIHADVNAARNTLRWWSTPSLNVDGSCLQHPDEASTRKVAAEAITPRIT